jgi:uncharacterized membrane protein YtjA (UPF0391 family)
LTVELGRGTRNGSPRCFGIIGAEADPSSEVTTMIGWAITFLIVALVAAIFGFGGIAGAAVDIAKLIFFVAIVLFAISAVIGLLRGRSPTL